jgi:Ca2+ transporting ATPase
MAGEPANHGTSSYGCTVKELMDLMELRGNEAIQAIAAKYNGVQGLCQRLKTDPVNGK